MARTPNDDRSDAKNPNNDSYRADHENRFGSDDDGGYDSAPGPAPPASPIDQRFGVDPHPLLGKRSNRLPGLSNDFGNDRPQEVVPWTEKLATASATDASEARDRELARDELFAVARFMFEEARTTFLRQGHTCEIAEGADEPSIRLILNGTKGVVVHSWKEHDVVFVSSAVNVDRRQNPFRFSRLRWHRMEVVRGAYGDGIGGYREQRDYGSSIADPSRAIFDALERMFSRC